MLGEPGFPGVERDASVGILGIGVRTAAQNQTIRPELIIYVVFIHNKNKLFCAVIDFLNGVTPYPSFGKRKSEKTEKETRRISGNYVQWAGK